jgi:hypothetical protein
VSDKTVVNFKVTGEGPTGQAQALFSNFLAVSQVGTEVQFEFVFLDLNLLAEMISQQKSAPTGLTVSTPSVSGKTVAKVVMPAEVFAQMKEHFDRIYNALTQEGIPARASEGKKDERHSTSVGHSEGS